MKKILLLPFLFLSFTIYAQTNVELITDRPDKTESSAAVPLKSLQIETGFVIENKSTDLFNHRSYAYNTTLLRYGLLQDFELRLGLEFLGDRFTMKQSNSVTKLSGFSPLYAGFKVKIAEEQGWRPEIAFLGGVQLPFSANKDYKPENVAANMGFAFAHTISERFSIGYNLGAEWLGEPAAPAYFYSLAIGIGLCNNLGMFAESYGLFNATSEPKNLANAGFTYLLLPNFQLDLSAGLGLNDNALDNFISFGFTLRIPD